MFLHKWTRPLKASPPPYKWCTFLSCFCLNSESQQQLPAWWIWGDTPWTSRTALWKLRVVSLSSTSWRKEINWAALLSRHFYEQRCNSRKKKKVFTPLISRRQKLHCTLNLSSDLWRRRTSVGLHASTSPVGPTSPAQRGFNQTVISTAERGDN